MWFEMWKENRCIKAENLLQNFNQAGTHSMATEQRKPVFRYLSRSGTAIILSPLFCCGRKFRIKFSVQLVIEHIARNIRCSMWRPLSTFVDGRSWWADIFKVREGEDGQTKGQCKVLREKSYPSRLGTKNQAVSVVLRILFSKREQWIFQQMFLELTPWRRVELGGTPKPSSFT